MGSMPQINRNNCDGCGLCVGVCGCRIISLVEDKAAIVSNKRCENCRTWCTLCEDICPRKAICCSFDVVIENRPE